MKQLIAWLLLSCVCFAQDPNTTIEQNSTFSIPPIESGKPWAEIQSNDYQYNGPKPLSEHIEDDHQHELDGASTPEEKRRRHEWLHKQVEKLKPDGSYSYIVVEASDADIDSWSERASIEAAGWKIVRQPLRRTWNNVVVIGKMHFSHAGRLTIAKLKQFVDQEAMSKFRQNKAARKPKFISKITMYSRDNCGWCDKWMALEYPKAIADGVLVDIAKDASGTVPRFDVCDGGGQVCRQYVGFKSYAAMKADIQ